MESTISRNRNTRYNYNSRRKKSLFYDQKRITRIIKQSIICAAIFVAFLTIKNIDNTITNNISTRIASILKTDTEINTLVYSVKQFLSSLNITNEKLQSVFNNQGLVNFPQSQKTNIIPQGMEEKIYDGELLKSKVFEVPVSGVITSNFGMRINPITKENEFHEGVDIDAKSGEGIKSTLDGQVIEAKSSESLGNYVKIKHEDELYSLYAHASNLLVKEGQMVKKGEVIANVGNTGYSVGNHLHFELRKGDKLVDPQKVINFNIGQSSGLK